MLLKKYNTNFIFNLTVIIICLLIFIIKDNYCGTLTEWIFILTVLTYINTVTIYNNIPNQ